MMSEWKKVKLGDFCDKIGSGATPTGGANVYLPKGDVAFIRSQHVYNEGFHGDGIVFLRDKDASALQNVSVNENDILINITGDSVARVCLAPLEFIPARVNQHVAIIRVNSDYFDARFVRYYLITPEMQQYLLSLACSGATRNALTKGMLENLDIPMPKLEEQRRIADILSGFDDKIELNRKMCKTLEAMAQALYKSWFVDFEPFKDGEFIDSELGPIPKGWKVLSAEKINNVSIGKTPPRKEPQWFSTLTADMPWISIRDIGNSGVFIFDTTEYLTKDAVRKFNVKVIPEKTVILSFKLTVGRVAITSRDMLSNEAIAHFVKKPQFDYVSNEYLYLYLKNLDYTSLGSTSSIATAVNSKIIKSIPIIIPTEDVFEKYSNELSLVFSKIQCLEIQNIKLENTRNLILGRILKPERDNYGNNN